MSDFADFTSAANPSSSQQNNLFGGSDPAADFLARESAVFGGDASAFLTSTATGSGSNDYNSLAISSTSATQFQPVEGFGDVDDFAAVVGNTASPGTLGSAGALETNLTGGAPSVDSTLLTTPSSATGSAPASAAVSYVPEIEHESVREYRNKQAQIIAERDARSERKQQETLEAAKRAIDKFYEDYNNKKEKAIKENRDNQTFLLATLNDTINGTIWERVLKHIDATSAESASSAFTGRSATNLTGLGVATKKVTTTKDTSRMKAILQSLKGDKEAPGCVVTGKV